MDGLADVNYPKKTCGLYASMIFAMILERTITSGTFYYGRQNLALRTCLDRIQSHRLLMYKASVFLHFNLHGPNLQRYHHPHRQSKDKQRSWALVTGASAGIGLAWVHELAARNFNVVLHGRNEEKLRGIILELEQQYKVDFKTLVLDSQASADSAFDKTVQSCFRGLNLTIVIHNVGGPGKGHSERVYQENITAVEVDGWIDINARFATHLTRLLLPSMIQNPPGLMLYISSAVSQMRVPSLAIYSSTKSYLETYAGVLDEEMVAEGYDIEVKALLTGTCVTTSSGRTEKDRSFTMPLTKDYVRSAIDKVGWNEVVITPWIGHQVQLAFMGCLPSWLFRKLMGQMLKKVEAEFAQKKKGKGAVQRLLRTRQLPGSTHQVAVLCCARVRP